MFSITREQFIEAAQAEIARIKAMAHPPDEDQAVIDWSLSRATEIQFAIDHLSAEETDWGLMDPTQMRALMEIIYG